MIEFISDWAKSLGLAIIIVSILEMLLPNNKTKKYIKVILGIYILFNIISPFVKNKEIFDLNKIDLEAYSSTQQSNEEVDQTSMDKRIIDLYEKELEKDIKDKLTKKGYIISNCRVTAKIGNKDEDTHITKIKLQIESKSEENSQEIQNNNNLENKILVEVQKIKPIETNINENKKDESINSEQMILNADIQNVKKFLMEEYGVNENCLEIN